MCDHSAFLNWHDAFPPPPPRSPINVEQESLAFAFSSSAKKPLFLSTSHQLICDCCGFSQPKSTSIASSPAFLMLYSAYLYVQPRHILFATLGGLVILHFILTVASWAMIPLPSPWQRNHSHGASGTPVPSIQGLNIWQFSFCTLLKFELQNLEHYITRMGGKCASLSCFGIEVDLY